MTSIQKAAESYRQEDRGWWMVAISTLPGTVVSIRRESPHALVSALRRNHGGLRRVVVVDGAVASKT